MASNVFLKDVIDHILWMKDRDIDYAREAAKWYADTLDWVDVKKELKLRVSTDRQLEKKDQNHCT